MVFTFPVAVVGSMAAMRLMGFSFVRVSVEPLARRIQHGPRSPPREWPAYASHLCMICKGDGPTRCDGCLRLGGRPGEPLPRGTGAGSVDRLDFAGAHVARR